MNDYISSFATLEPYPFWEKRQIGQTWVFHGFYCLNDWRHDVKWWYMTTTGLEWVTFWVFSEIWIDLASSTRSGSPYISATMGHPNSPAPGRFDFRWSSWPRDHPRTDSKKIGPRREKIPKPAPLNGSWWVLGWNTYREDWNCSRTNKKGFGHQQSDKMETGWWFGTFFIFPYIGDNHPNWLIFFRGVGQPPTRRCMRISPHKDVRYADQQILTSAPHTPLPTPQELVPWCRGHLTFFSTGW